MGLAAKLLIGSGAAFIWFLLIHGCE